jgi:ribosome-binding factor A
VNFCEDDEEIFHSQKNFMSKRTDQLSTEISRKLSLAISEIFSLDDSGVFTIRTVDVTTDLMEARVYISRIGGDPDFFKRLEKTKNRIKKMVFADMQLRRHPEIIFHEDFTGEYAEKMEGLLK